MHAEEHPLSGKTVKLGLVALDPRGIILPGVEFRVEDWVDRLGASWKLEENWATIHYAYRQASAITISETPLPDDDEVVYGKIGRFGHCVHASELDG